MREVTTAIVQSIEVEAMTKSQLGVHLKSLCRAGAKTLWEIGKAVAVARTKVPRMERKEWLSKNCPGIPYPTLMRWKDYYLADPTGKTWGQTVTESYKVLGITNASKSREKRKEALNVVEVVAHKLNRIVKDRAAVAPGRTHLELLTV